MIPFILEARRRLIWLWRLATSAAFEEHSAGVDVVLWVFDTRTAPDGYTLLPLIGGLAEQKSVSIWSFGPRPLTLSSFLRFLRWAPLAAGPGFTDRFETLYGTAFDVAWRASKASRVVSGSFNGVFGSLTRRRIARKQRWELQHGFLDQSYFPIRAAVFFARSELARRLIASRQADIQVEMTSLDLEPPHGEKSQLRPGDVSEVHCFSKNPGGGCTTQEVRELETFAAGLAHRLKASFHLHLHPRDNVLKLAIRHRGLAITADLARKNQATGTHSRLVVSSFSTALATRSRAGDVLLNIQVSVTPADDIREAQYGWLPTIFAASNARSGPIPVLRRLS